MRAVLSVLALLVLAVPTLALDSPQWWKENRAIYSAFALSGAGGPLMKYPSQDIKKKLGGSFENLPSLLDDARKLGCSCIYLVDYWQPNYESKGDYIPRSDLGGPETFKKGVAAVHARGGKIILYLEAFIVTRNNPVGLEHPDWAMMDADGKYYTYYGRDRFYLMYPGEGSGWSEYICGLAEKMVRDYGVDGFHLDSYGCQWDWKDYNPNHPGATDPAKFNQGAVNLVKTLRERIRKINPDAVVILECSERPELLDVCDGGQLDSAAWQYSPIKVLNEKPWVKEKRYDIFTSHFSVEEDEKILGMGYNLSLCPWFLGGKPGDSEYEDMRERISDKDEWHDRIVTLWQWDNLLYVNGVARPQGVDLFQLRRDLEMARYGKDKYYDTSEYFRTVEAYIPLVKRLYTSGKPVKSVEQYMREIMGRAQ